MERNSTWLPVVALALRDENGRWLMQQRPANKDHAGLWEFPGGKVESCETPRMALVREVYEELGLVLDQSELTPLAFADGPHRPTVGDIVIMLYTAELRNPSVRSMEGGTLQWLSLAEMHDFAMPPLDTVLHRLLTRLVAKD